MLILILSMDWTQCSYLSMKFFFVPWILVFKWTLWSILSIAFIYTAPWILVFKWTLWCILSIAFIYSAPLILVFKWTLWCISIAFIYTAPLILVFKWTLWCILSIALSLHFWNAYLINLCVPSKKNYLFKICLLINF